MKITQLREKDGNLTLSTTDLDTFLQKIKTETKTQPVSTFRQQLRYCLPGKRCNEADRLPKVLPAAEFRKTNGVCQMKTYNGIVELTVGPLSGKSEIALVKRLAWEQPQTRLVFTGSSGRTVKIWTTFTRPNNSLPGKREEAEVFHAHAYRLAVKCYQPQLPFDILLKEPKLEQYSRLSFDPEAMYRPDSIQFYLAQPASMPDETTYREALQDEKSPLTRAVPGYEAEEAIIMQFEAALQKTFAEATGAGADNSLHSLTVRLAENCFRSGIPEEETVKRTYFHYYLRQKETVIRQIVRSVYQENKGFNTQSSLSKEQRLAIQTDEFMKRRYDFRYNTQVGEVEYRERHSFRFRFSPIDKRTLNSIALDAQSEGIPLWDRDISRYIYSNRIPVFNPLEDYLYDLPHWDGKDRIRALAGLVPCTNPYWQELFYRWFLSMVAHWRGVDRQHGNSTSPLLVGPQGYRKSTFCRIILPPELRFGYTDSIDFKSKQEAERYLGRFFLINIDEFDQINVSQQGFLKHLLQKPVANLRKPHGNTIREMRRYASFIGTSNQKDLLTDPSGSRRFICIEVTAPINTNVTINYKQLYAQAMEAIYKGERYWLNDEDENILKQTNREFEQASPLEQLFHCYLNPVEEEMEGEWLTAMQILSYLQTKTRDKLAINKVGQFGRALQKLNIPCRKSRKGTLYHLMKVE
mgnify:CR=1 FL=1